MCVTLKLPFYSHEVLISNKAGMADKKIPVKFVVDEVRRKVILAEANNDFVNILFSFLTLPLGTIIRLLNKQSRVGCMDKLYESVENLDVQQFQTEACKTMLLSPRSAAAVHCEDLEVNIDDTKPGPREIYVCPASDCCAKATCLCSCVPKARCPHCGETMDRVMAWVKSDADAEKLFVKNGVTFIISDSLQIMESSAANTLYLLLNMGVKDASLFEERSMDLGRDEILALLRRSLVSNVPLTDLCFHGMGGINDASNNINVESLTQVKTEESGMMDSKDITMKLFLNKTNNKLSFVEAGEEFVNLVFTFLSLPLGSVIKLLNKNTLIGCVDNLYLSISSLSLDCFKSEECKSMVLSPKLGPFFGCTSNIQMLDESTPRNGSVRGCFTCYWENKSKECHTGNCVHGIDKAVFKELNPKSREGMTGTGGGYAKAAGKFLVTEDLHVSPLSAFSTIQIIGTQDLSLSDVVVKDVSIGEAQALNLLRAALISKTPLADVFSPDWNGRKMH